MFHEFNLSIDQLMVFANISNVAPFNNLDICIYKLMFNPKINKRK